MFKIRLVPVGTDDGPGVRWQLYTQDAGKPFLEARKLFRLRDDAYRDAESFLRRRGKSFEREAAPQGAEATAQR